MRLGVGGCSDAGRMVLLVLALCCAPAASDRLLRGFSEELERNLTKVLNVSYIDVLIFRSDFGLRVERLMLPQQQPFDPRGMGMLYKVTPVIMDTIVKKKGFLHEDVAGIVVVKGKRIDVDTRHLNWRKLLPHYAGPITFVICFALFGLLLPVAGLFWCCCHMCRGGRRRRPFDRKHDACLKGLLAILLIALLTLFLFGVVCSFATEQQLEEGLQHAAATVAQQAAVVQDVLNGTTTYISDYIKSYADPVMLAKKVAEKMKAAAQAVSDTISSWWGSVFGRSLHSMVQQLDDVQRDLREVQQLTSTLRFQAEQLNTGLRKVKRNLLQTLANCDMSACVNLQRKHRIGELNTDIQYSQMPDVSKLLNNVTALLDGHIKEEVADGLRVLENIQRKDKNEYAPSLRQQLLPGIGQTLINFGNTVKEIGGEVIREVKKVEDKVTKISRELHGSYGRYRRYAGLGVVVALLLITLLLACGLLCGVCGKRPDVYGASSCCNKGRGSRCLHCGMILIFMTGTVFCVMTIAYFVTGMLVQRLLCDSLNEPRNNTVFKTVDKLVNLEKLVYRDKSRANSNFTITDLLAGCHQNRTIYQLAQVPRLVESLMPSIVLRDDAALRPEKPEPVFPSTRVVLLRDSAKRKLRMLADSGLYDFQFDRIFWALETNMTSLELLALARTLERTADSVGAHAEYGAVPAELRAQAGELQLLHVDIVASMLRHTAALNETAYRLHESLSFTRTSMKEAILQLLDKTARAENFLNEKGAQTARALQKTMSSTLVFMIEKVFGEEILGYGGPYSKVLNVTRDSVCRNLLLPLNGYWVSVGYCVLLLLPLLLVSALLAQLYLLTDPYPGPLIEAVYKADKQFIRKPLGRGGVCGGGAGTCAATVSAGSGLGSRARSVAGRGAGEAAALAPPLETHHAVQMPPARRPNAPPALKKPAVAAAAASVSRCDRRRQYSAEKDHRLSSSPTSAERRRL